MMDTPFAIYDALASIEVPPDKVRAVVQSMEHDMALFATRSQFDQLDQFSGSRFELLRAEISATRAELTAVRSELTAMRTELTAVRQRMDEQFEPRLTAAEVAVRQVSADLKALELRLTIKLGSFLVVAVATTATIVRLLQG